MRRLIRLVAWPGILVLLVLAVIIVNTALLVLATDATATKPSDSEVRT